MYRVVNRTMRNESNQQELTMKRRDLERSVEALVRMTVGQLRQKHLEVFGEPTNAANKDYLAKRLASRIQCFAEGGLSERAKARAMELAGDADLRTTVPRMPPRGTTATACVTSNTTSA
jgi:hypothetical protein